MRTGSAGRRGGRMRGVMIILDYRDTRPLYEQIVDKFQNLIIRGVLEPNSRMPSVRSLAVELSINPNTIQRAYSELERTGFIYTVKGRGNFVAYDDSLREVRRAELYEKLEALAKEAGELGVSRAQLAERLLGGAAAEAASGTAGRAAGRLSEGKARPGADALAEGESPTGAGASADTAAMTEEGSGRETE